MADMRSLLPEVGARVETIDEEAVFCFGVVVLQAVSPLVHSDEFGDWEAKDID